MSKRLVSIVVIVAVVVFSESCIFYKTKRYLTESQSRGPGPRASIVRVKLKSGETREFKKKDPAHLINGEIVWTGPTISVSTKGSADVAREGDHYIIKTGDGRTYRTSFYRLDAGLGRLTYATQESASIPLKDVATIWTREIDKVLSILAWVPVGCVLLISIAWSNVMILPGPII